MTASYPAAYSGGRRATARPKAVATAFGVSIILMRLILAWSGRLVIGQCRRRLDGQPAHYTAKAASRHNCFITSNADPSRTDGLCIAGKARKFRPFAPRQRVPPNAIEINAFASRVIVYRRVHVTRLAHGYRGLFAKRSGIALSHKAGRCSLRLANSGSKLPLV